MMEEPFSSIFIIFVEYGDTGVGQCTGFLVSSKVVLTAAHCLEEDGIKKVLVLIPEKEGEYRKLIASGWEISAKYDSKRSDFAGIFLPEPVASKAFKLAMFTGKKGDVFYSAGFPKKKKVFPLEMRETPLSMSEQIDGFLVLDGVTHPGWSGGPLYLKGKGELVSFGLLSRGDEKSTAAFQSFNKEALREISGWLKKNK